MELTQKPWYQHRAEEVGYKGFDVDVCFSLLLRSGYGVSYLLRYSMLAGSDGSFLWAGLIGGTHTGIVRPNLTQSV